MAHEIFELDRVVMANTPAWHKLGTVVTGHPSAVEAIRLASMDWNVELEPLSLPDGLGGWIEAPDTYATVRMDLQRTDVRRILGTVGGRYTPIQNSEAFAIVDDLAQPIETAGTLRNGRLAWVMCKAPDAKRVGDDTLQPYLLVSTSHDGTRALSVQFTSVRVVCSNTLSAALNRTRNSVSVRHSANKASRIADAKRVLGLADEYFDKHTETMNKLAAQSVDRRFASAYVQSLIPDPVDTKVSSTRAENARGEVLRLFNGRQKGANMQAVKGTAYGLYNALAEYTDHHRSTRTSNGRSEADARFESTMFGSGAALKANGLGLLQRVLTLDAPDRSAEVDAIMDSFTLAYNVKPSVDSVMAGIAF